MSGSHAGARRWVRLRVAGILDRGTRLAFVIMVAGVVLMLAAGLQPGAGPARPPSLGDWLASLLALEPDAFIWVGIGLTAILPAVTVVVAGVGYLRVGNRRAALTALSVLVALAATIVVATLTR